MEKLLTESIQNQVRDIFKQLKHPVAILLFVSRETEEISGITRQLLEEVSSLSEKLSLSVYDLAAEPELARLYRVENKAPAIVMAAREETGITDYGIRLLGVPSGHEFGTLIQDLILVSGRDSGLSPQTRAYIQSLKAPLHLEVFVTPT